MSEQKLSDSIRSHFADWISACQSLKSCIPILRWADRAAELEAEVALYKQALRLSAIDELRLSQSYGDYDYLIDARCEYRLNQAREGAEHAPCN